MAAAVLMLCASIAFEIQAHQAVGLRPTDSGYGAAVYGIAALQGLFVAISAIMGLYTVARSLAGMLSAQRRQTFDNTRLFFQYTAVQGLAGLALVHGFPRLLLG